MVLQIPHGVPEEEAVRIFVAFNRMEAAIKGIHSMLAAELPSAHHVSIIPLSVKIVEYAWWS